jgi:hypothetical protein
MPPARKSPFDKGAAAAAPQDDDDNDHAADGGGDAGESAGQPTLQLDSGETVGFVKFFNTMEPPPERTIRFFHRKKGA